MTPIQIWMHGGIWSFLWNRRPGAEDRGEVLRREAVGRVADKLARALGYPSLELMAEGVLESLDAWGEVSRERVGRLNVEDAVQRAKQSMVRFAAGDDLAARQRSVAAIMQNPFVPTPFRNYEAFLWPVNS